MMFKDRVHDKRFTVGIFLLIIGLPAYSFTQTNYQPNPGNLASREWFQDSKFGMFIHWGVYSLLARGEWIMNNDKIQIIDYERLPSQFNPTQFDPVEWVDIVKAAGMKYITITSKHHDGFAMFDSKISDYDILDRTPYKKDVLKMLADECHKQNIKLFFYHSQLDWHHPDYFPRGRTGRDAGRLEQGDWYRYIDYMNNQLKELLTNYGEIGGIWFDGWWDRPEADWQLWKTYTLIHDLQPQALIGSNHHRRPFPGEDFQMFEKDLPGGKTAEFNQDSEISELPLETCETINGSWGFHLTDKRYKSTRELIQYLVKAAGNNANFLLNIGPMPNGKIQPEFVDRLKAMGQWLVKYGEAIYGTRGGPVAPRSWGVTTQKGYKIYVHVLNWNPQDALFVPLTRVVKSAYFLKDNSTAAFRKVENGILLKPIPKTVLDDFDTIIVAE